MTYPLRILGIFIIVISSSLTSTALAAVASEKISPTLWQTPSDSEELIDVVVFLEENGAHRIGKFARAFESPRRAASHQFLIEEMKEPSSEQIRFDEKLRDLIEAGTVSKNRHFWIAGATALTIRRSAVAELAALPEVHYIVEDAELELVTPVSSAIASAGMAGSSTAIDLSGVRQLWEMGYTGHGRIVCGFDTGVEYDHPALTSNWVGNDGSPAEQSWFDPYGADFPGDLGGHGTHTMGIMAGRDGADTIGVAFNARWMAAGVIDRGQTLSRTISDILAAFEWAADPDGNPTTVDDLPDVICNSWGIPRGLLPTCDNTFWGAIDNLEALGVVVIFACGNEGPDPGTIRNPADRAISPASAFSVGAVNQKSQDLPVASFSSRGPSSCDENVIKPEITAPGVEIRSSYKGGGYRVMSGTSMAAPFIAGCVALLREYNPDATVAQLKNALLLSASDLGPSGQDNGYGWGFVNLADAIQLLPKPQKPRISKESLLVGNSQQTILQPGSTHNLVISVSNDNVPAEEIHGVLRSGSSAVYIMRDTSYFGSLAVGNGVDNSANPFIVKIDGLSQPGTAVGLTVDFYANHYGYLNSVDFELILGQTVTAECGVISTNRLSAEVTNFGRSQRFVDATLGGDLLANLNLVVAAEDEQVYDAYPGSLDWQAGSPLNSIDWGVVQEINGGFKSLDGRFGVRQSTKVVDNSEGPNFLLLDIEVSDRFVMEERVTVGLAADFDLVGGEAVIEDGNDLLFQSADLSQIVGIRPVFDNSIASICDGSVYKTGATSDGDKFELLQHSSQVLSSYPSDLAVLLSTGSIPFDGAGTRRVGFVIASGATVDEVLTGLTAGADLFLKPTDADDNLDAVLPQNFSLEQNFPNPFNATTRIDFDLLQAGEYQLTIFNTLGQVVREYTSVTAAPGVQHLEWDGRSLAGIDVASGVYLYRLTFNGSHQTRKMVLLK